MRACATALFLLVTAAPAVSRGQSQGKEPLGKDALSVFRADVDFEYRAQHLSMRPLSLNDLTAPDVAYFDQRFRFNGRFFAGDRVNVRVMADLLDGVLFGDNGSFVGSPRRNRGSVVATKSPNLARIAVDQIDPNGGSLDPDNYGFVLVEAEPITVRMLYGEVLLPFGLLRVGRQPLTNGRNVLVHEGTRINRWGVSRQPDVVDGVAFGTKLSAVADAIAGNAIDADPDRGLFLGILFGQPVENAIQLDDDLTQIAGTIFYKESDLFLLGHEVSALDVGATYSYRFADQFDSNLTGLSGFIIAEVGDFFFSAFHMQLLGSTREVSEGLALLGSSSGPPADQEVAAFGGFAEVAYRAHPFELIFEIFYASGDDTPKSDQPINQLTFAEDTNVGLHLFENVVHYQTARAAARGVTNLKAIAPPSFPVAEINSRGGLQNAIVLFPQVVVTPFDWLDIRAGAMFAFTQKPNVDPIGTILSSTGRSLEDDLINFNGGKPGDYWGTEFDVGLTYKPVDGFLLDLEGAYLIPGNALRDEHGDAVNSIYGNIRFTFFYD